MQVYGRHTMCKHAQGVLLQAQAFLDGVASCFYIALVRSISCSGLCISFDPGTTTACCCLPLQ